MLKLLVYPAFRRQNSTCHLILGKPFMITDFYGQFVQPNDFCLVCISLDMKNDPYPGMFQVLALTVVSVGVAVATVTDLQFHFFGACIAVAWIVPSAVNKILWSNLQQQENWTALALMWKTTPITLFFLVMLMPSLDPPGVLSFNWNFYNSTIIGASAVLGFLLQWSGALALGATSATTHVVLGQFKTCVILLGGYLLFGSNPGPTSILGAITALVGMSFYTYLNLHSQQQQQSSKTSSRQSPLSLSKSKLGKENADGRDGNRADESV
ncbi:hypothetical protein HAX54_012293 [Datura stramonium]|uniref:Sugar phosphate transporter domain-containing protein n=1 Tax=Datura stramonium TaxID=4076 RepID=A0ABS8TLF9_DATST|nr:hypothetical protein [Datura stramonium]